MKNLATNSMLPMAIAVDTSPVMNQAIKAVVVVATTRHERGLLESFSGVILGILLVQFPFYLLCFCPSLCEGLDLSASVEITRGGRDDNGWLAASLTPVEMTGVALR